jgi:PAS domain S-box-containing protein
MLDRFHSKAEWERLREVYARCFAEGGMASVECTVRARDGTERAVILSGAGYDLDGQDVVMLEFQDITDRKRVEAALSEAEKRLRTVVANSPVVLFALDAHGTFTLSEGRGLEALGLEPGAIVGCSVWELYEGRPDILDNMRRTLEGEQFVAVTEIAGVVFETWHTPVRDENGRVVGMTGVATDITARHRLEEQLRQAQKMEAIGRLAGGVAHDFNNLLAAITGHGELMMRGLEARHPLHRHAEEILKASTRGALLTRQLLAFSRKELLAPAELDLNLVVAEMEELLRRLIGEHIQLETRLPVHPIGVRADRSQLEQVIMNLAVNARDAMPRGGQLTIDVGTLNRESDPDAAGSAARSGAFATLTVSDTGCGMDTQTLAHAFEPFFTTKGIGKGTGLGLSTVYGIVEHSGGTIDVSSEVNRGTTIRVALPRVAAPERATPANATPALAPSGRETVLLVEDEAAVRTMARDALEANGYVVLEARHGVEALELVDRHTGTIHILVTDVVMPHMGGGELAQRLMARDPFLRVVFMSGHPDDALVHQGVSREGSAFLPKPFSLGSLAKKVRDLLDAPARGAEPDGRAKAA